MTTATLPHVRTELDRSGRLVRAWIPSRSDYNKTYEMVRSPQGWRHAPGDTSCPAWAFGRGCHHVADLERVTKMDEHNGIDEEEPTAGALVVTSYPVDLTLMTGADVIGAMSQALTPMKEWRYEFRQGGQTIAGLSAQGVQDGVRALSTKGESIRILDCHMESQTDEDAFFVASAGRYVITNDGRETLFDSVIRGKRVPKRFEKADGELGARNPHWYEHGITKASRNAAMALMPVALKKWMQETARAAVVEGTGRDPGQTSGGAPPLQRANGTCAVCNAPAGKPHSSKCSAAGTVNSVPAAPPAAEKPRAARLQIADLLKTLEPAVRAAVIGGINQHVNRKAINENGELMLGKVGLTEAEAERVLAWLRTQLEEMAAPPDMSVDDTEAQQAAFTT